jgi:hypothetical protein
MVRRLKVSGLTVNALTAMSYKTHRFGLTWPDRRRRVAPPATRGGPMSVTDELPANAERYAATFDHTGRPAEVK